MEPEPTALGRSLTQAERDLASAVFSPGYYVAAMGLPAWTFAGQAFAHFVDVGVYEPIAPSPLFDPLVYRERSLAAGHGLTEAEAASFFHWLRHGMARGIVPTAFFDEDHYTAANPDVARLGGLGYTHFLRFGLAEGRAPNPDFDASAAVNAGGPSSWSLLDAHVRRLALHPERPDAIVEPEDAPAGHSGGYSVAWRWRAGVTLQQDMLEDPFARYYAGIDLDGGPLLAWAKQVASCWPLPESRAALDHTVAGVRASPLFDPEHYRSAAAIGADLDAALHYVLLGEALGIAPSPEFDPGYYASRNPDVMRTGMNLLLHYAEYGRGEGRYGCPPPDFHRNPARFDPARRNVIVVVHEASRTGAPILGWNIVQHLAERYNVFTVCLGGGALAPAFEASSAETHGPFPRTQRHTPDMEHGLRPLLDGRVFDYAIVNSSESRPVLETFARHLVPTVFLMHEFGSYVHPAKSLQLAFDWATEIVFSAPMVARSSEAMHPPLRDRPIRILPQGMSVIPPGNAPAKPPPVDALAHLSTARAKGTLLVIGAGTVDLRKGVDLFLMAAAAARRASSARRVHFVWVGHGYRPDEDMGYSVYLQEQLRRSTLEDEVTFLGEVSDLDAVYALADIFLLTSRLDPLPNVSIDAAYRAIPIICFHDASGIADLLLEDPGTAPGVVAHLDAEAAGRLIARLADDEPARRQMAEAAAGLARRVFDMEHYVEQLDALGTSQAGRFAQLRDDAALLLGKGGFDQDFFLGPAAILEPPGQTVGGYLASGGWAAAASRRTAPGFDPDAWAHAHPGQSGDSLTAFLRAGRPDGAWLTPVIGPPADPAALSAGDLRPALHVHLPDPAQVAPLLLHLRPNVLPCDLLVSTDTEAKVAALESALAAYGPGRTTVHVLAGDLPSLIAELGGRLAGYDVVGHAFAGPGDADDPWREFQWQRVLGGRHAMRDCILDAFARTPGLGLVSAADPHPPAAPGSGDRGGGMAWMRAGVLQQLARLGTPGPGAFDRPLPGAARAAGLSQAVVHVPGVAW